MSDEKQSTLLEWAATNLKVEDAQWAADALQDGLAGIDRVLFRKIATPLLDGGFYLRERELYYFGIEEWLPAPRECVLGKGEITCLYSVCSGQAVSPVPMRKILPLVDFVFNTTGAGVGAVLSDDGNGQHSGVAVNLRTGRRARVRVTNFFGPPPFIAWVERTEAGRGSGSLGSQAARGSGLL